MKSCLCLLVVAVEFSLSAQNMQITRLERTGALAWTNHFCTTRPVYEVQVASSLTSDWQRVLVTTNQTTAVLTNLGNGERMAFYRVAWLEDEPVDFTYNFLQDLGDEMWCNSVTGRVSLALWKPTATWRFTSTSQCAEPCAHTIGNGEWSLQPLAGADQWRMGSFLLYWVGRLETTNTAQGPAYTRFTGEVIQHGFASDFPIGQFIAERVVPP